MYDQSKTIGEFLVATAAKQPTPGGGSVAALAGALAAAMGEMCLNYSVGKKGAAPAREAALQQALSEMHRARHLMLELMREDQSAYEALTAARKLAKDSPDRQGQIDVTLLACIRTPQALAACALAVLELVDRTAEFCNVYMLSDLAVCAELAMATVRSGVYNVRANLPSLAEDKERRHFAEATEKILAHAIASVKHGMPRIWERHRLEMK